MLSEGEVSLPTPLSSFSSLSPKIVSLKRQLQSFLFETLTEGVTKQGNLTSHCFMYFSEQLFQFLLAAFALSRIWA